MAPERAALPHVCGVHTIFPVCVYSCLLGFSVSATRDSRLRAPARGSRHRAATYTALLSIGIATTRQPSPAKRCFIELEKSQRGEAPDHAVKSADIETLLGLN